MPIFHFYTPCKRQKTRCFLTFSECKEIIKKVIGTRLRKVKSHCWCYSVQEEYKQVKEIQYLKKLTNLPIYSIILKTTFKQQTLRN